MQLSAIMVSDNTVFMAQPSASARRRLRYHRAAQKDPQNLHAVEISSLKQRIEHLEWFMCYLHTGMPSMLGDVNSEPHPEVEPTTTAMPEDINSQDYTQESFNRIPLQGLSDLCAQLDQLNASLVDSLCSDKARVNEDAYQMAPCSPLVCADSIQQPLLVVQECVFEDTYYFSTTAAEEAWKGCGNEHLCEAAPVLRKIGAMLCQLDEVGSMTQEEYVDWAHKQETASFYEDSDISCYGGASEQESDEEQEDSLPPAMPPPPLMPPAQTSSKRKKTKRKK